MKILVTRPQPAGIALVDALRSQGKSAWNAPLINISPGSELEQLPEKLHHLNKDDFVFLLSKNAVYHANEYLHQRNMNWSDKLKYYGIGRSTAQYFNALTQRPILWSEQGETSEVLLTLPSLQDVSGKRILLLRGNGGREHLATTLIERGAQIDYCECYKREPVCYQGDEFSQYWQQIGIDTLVVTSGEMLHHLYELIPDDDRKAWLNHCLLLVVSERLAKIARELGWHDIIIAKSAENNALLQALTRTDMGRLL